MATFTPTTETHIANMALSRLGERAITDITANTTRTEKAAESHFGGVRDEVLNSHYWNFAQKVVRFEEADDDGGDDAEQWGYSYPLPADFIRVVRPYPAGMDFEIVGRHLFAHFVPFDLKYTARVTDPEDWTPDFKKCVSLLLAHRIGQDIRGSEQLVSQIMQEYEFALSDATHRDAVESGPRSVGGSSWVNAREGYEYDEGYRGYNP